MTAMTGYSIPRRIGRGRAWSSERSELSSQRFRIDRSALNSCVSSRLLGRPQTAQCAKMTRNSPLKLTEASTAPACHGQFTMPLAARTVTRAPTTEPVLDRLAGVLGRDDQLSRRVEVRSSGSCPTSTTCSSTSCLLWRRSPPRWVCGRGDNKKPKEHPTEHQAPGYDEHRGRAKLSD